MKETNLETPSTNPAAIEADLTPQPFEPVEALPVKDQAFPLDDQALAFNDQDFKAALFRALRLVAILLLIGTPTCWLLAGRSSALLYLVGSVIAGSSIWVWQRLMGTVLDRLAEGGTPRPAAPVVLWFFAHLIFSGGLLYVSLRGSNGSVYALIAGLGLALLALMVEALRLLKTSAL